MLDINKLALQIPGISEHLKNEAIASKKRLSEAKKLLKDTAEKQRHWLKIQEQWRDHLIFSPATPVEEIDIYYPISSPPESHTVFATDGSQISPSHHEITYCYLINIGRVMLHYGQSLHPLLDSLPEVYYKPEDLYISQQWNISTEEWMGYRRTVLEAQILSELATRWVLPPGAHQDTPNLALVDGSLIYWFLDKLLSEAKDQLLPPILAAWEDLRNSKIPLLGYLSASRSMESVNFLRFPACPFDFPNCIINCREERDHKPCQVIQPLRDTTLWGSFLPPGHRSALWCSNLRILDYYDEPQRVYFCYVNVGEEIARIEIPAWIAEDSTLFEQSLSIVLAQVYKGYGYPVALAEAHNMAVVRSADRHRFFSLLEQEMLRSGLKNVSISSKEARKRGSIA
jgi:NurA domain